MRACALIPKSLRTAAAQEAPGGPPIWRSHCPGNRDAREVTNLSARNGKRGPGPMHIVADAYLPIYPGTIVQSLKIALTTIVGLASACFVPAFAADWQINDIDVSINSTATWGLGLRAGDPSCELTGDPNSDHCGASANTQQWAAADNGNLNYKSGQLFTNYLKFTTEILVTDKDAGISAMARGSYLYDFAAADTDRTKLNDSAEEQIVYPGQLLDLWVSKQFQIGNQNWRARLGNQVINWGESLFLPGGIDATNAIDFQKSLIPGTQIKEYVLPAPMLSLAGSITSGLNVEAYYQFGWNKTIYPPVGTYWSFTDSYGNGIRDPVTFSTSNYNVFGVDAAQLAEARGNSLVSRNMQTTLNKAIIAGQIPGVVGAPILLDRNPPQEGQFGISAHYKPPGSTIDLGLYFLNYHDKSPVATTVPDAAASAGIAYQYSFRANRQLVGLSTNFPLGDWAIGGELSYRPHDAVSLGTCFTPGQPLDSNVNRDPIPSGNCPLFEDRQKYELHLTGLLQMSPSDYPFILNNLRAQTGFLSIELVGTEYPGVNPNGMERTIEGVEVIQLPDAGYVNWLNNAGKPNATPEGVGTAASGGAVVDFNWTYDGSLIPGWQVTPGITYFRALFGDTPTFSANYLQNAQSLNFYVLFNQNPSVWQAGINFTYYFGGTQPSEQFYSDRSFLGAFVSYNF